MAADRPLGDPDEPTASRFTGLLSADASPLGPAAGEDRSFASDLNLGQVLTAMVQDRSDPEQLESAFYHQLHDVDAVLYRQEVFGDLDDLTLSASLERFVGRAAEVRAHLRQLEKMTLPQQREGWHLDAAAIYCDSVRELAKDLAASELTSRALVAFRDYLDAYLHAPGFAGLSADTAACREALAQIRYCVRIRNGHVTVSRYEGQPDYSEQVLQTFARFQQDATADYRVSYRTRPGINHVTAQILQLVARLFPEEFGALHAYFRRHRHFFDETIGRFQQDVQFFLAYLGCIRPLAQNGLSFCLPRIADGSTEICAEDTFDLALAAKLAGEGRDVVPNSFTLTGPERVFVVTGPNQGGKTTFARTFGQLHHLASLGCPVPGSAARLRLFDRILTHFEREEDSASGSGRLEDDIVRVRELLGLATAESIIVLNEVFTSTTLRDARFLGSKLLTKVIEIGALCVDVTFVDELAAMGPSVVSMMSTVVPKDPAQRTYKVVRRPADGVAHAIALAERHGVTYERLRERLSR